ncbi:MAG: radical SAM protein [bacterium]
MKKTNIIFVVPPAIPIEEFLRDDPTTGWTYPSIPLGILSIASYVGAYAKDVDFTILDLSVEISSFINDSNGLSLNDFIKQQMSDRCKGKSPDIIGISAIFNSNGGYLHFISSQAKGLWPDVLVVAGGGLPTNMPEYVFENAPDVDALNIGEGEKSFLELVLADDRKVYLSSAQGWMTKGRINSTSAAPVISDLDEIPFLRYDLIDIKSYQGYHHQGTEGGKTLAVPIMTSRGCPYRCNFCSSHTVHGRRIRHYSTNRILADICRLKEDFNIKNILVEDDLFLGNKKEALQVLDSISQKNLTVEFTNGLSVNHIDEEISEALRSSGVEMASLAVESGCERVLNEIIHKPYKKLSRVREVVKLLREKDIYIRAFFVIGFPGETMEELMETVSFMKDVGFNWCAVMIATPIAGSELYEYCKKNNLLMSDKEDDFHFGKCSIKLLHSTPEEFEKLRYLINLEVNFVENYDLKNGHLRLALNGFQDVINRVPKHAFAHYYSSLCYNQVKNKELARESINKYFKIINASDEWREYAIHFKLPVK